MIKKDKDKNEGQLHKNIILERKEKDFIEQGYFYWPKKGLGRSRNYSHIWLNNRYFFKT